MHGLSYFTLCFNEEIRAQIKKKTNGIGSMVLFWGRDVNVKYCTSIMFGHTKAEDVKGILNALEKLVVPLRLMLFLGMDGP